MPFYVTKYGLTQGIWKVNDLQAQIGEGGYLYVGEGSGLKTQVAKKDWFTNEAEAVARVNQQRDARIKSLSSAISKLEKYVPAIKDVP